MDLSQFVHRIPSDTDKMEAMKTAIKDCLYFVYYVRSLKSCIRSIAACKLSFATRIYKMENRKILSIKNAKY